MLSGASDEMANRCDIWELGSSDDSISVTSTKASEHSEDHEFEVKCILAERKRDGERIFLVEWVGYPEERHLWVTKDCFAQCDDVLKGWNERKKRISKGLEEPYDTRAWELRVKRLEQESDKRKERRAKKRRRLAQQVDTLLQFSDVQISTDIL